MAVASWMLKGRNAQWGSLTGRAKNDKDLVRLDFDKDPFLNATEILQEISKPGSLTEGRHLNYLNAFVKLILHVKENIGVLGYSVPEILLCLRTSCCHESTHVRSGALRAIRHLISTESDIVHFNTLLFPALLARSLDLVLKTDVERIESMKLMRKILLISPPNFDIGMARSLVALANGGIEERDRMLRVCLAILCELGVLNSEVFVLCGGVGALTRNLSECQSPKISEALCGVLLFLLDKPITRCHASVDLHCVAAPYCDFHYRHDWSDKNRDERELSFKCSRLTLLSILRSWPGILHFCSPQDTSGLKALVDVLYLDQLEVRKAILDLLYDLLGLSQPEWTDELSVALTAIDPSEAQTNWRLNEGFVAAEGKSILPHLSRTTPNLTEMHMSLLLYCFLETGLLGALGEVISTSDTFISVRATVLLGELLRLIQIFLPPECSNITPALPNLLEYATYNKPQALRAITALQQLHKLLKRRPASYSLYLDFILQSGSFVKSSNKLQRLKKYKLSHSRSKIAQLVLKDGDEEIKETGVLQNKDAYTWNWNLIKLILRRETEFTLNTAETNHRTFLKRLTEFFTPSSNRYSHMDLTNAKTSQSYTMVGIELIELLASTNDTFCEKLLDELFNDITDQITQITSKKSAHDCLFSPQHMQNNQCQSYFLFVGRFATTKTGKGKIQSLQLYEKIKELAVNTKHDCYAKLIVSSLDYNQIESRQILSEILTCNQEFSRLYATQFLLVLLRAGLPNFNNWGIKLLVKQLGDKSKTVRNFAINILQESLESSQALETLIKQNPNLLDLGEKGILILVRFLSTKNGFSLLNKNDFVINEIKRWDDFFNYRYVALVETELADNLTLHQRGDDGRYDKRTSSIRSVKDKRDLFVPPHLYGQLSKLPEGFRLLLEYGSVEKMIQTLESGFCETNEDIANMKAALWCLGHFGTSVEGLDMLIRRNILHCIIQIVENCVVYSIRATGFYTLGLVATMKLGADHLFKLGWVCARHDRHDRWPIIEEENWAEKQENEPIYEFSVSVEDSDRTSSDQVYTGEFYIPDADSSTTDNTDTDLAYPHSLSTQQKSSTLPINQQNSMVSHKRSLSESKTFEITRGSDLRQSKDIKFNLELPHRHRDNSVTESTTSGVSSCDSVMGKCIMNEKTQTLSPIPSSSSLIMIKPGGVKVRRHSESSRRISMQSTPSDKPSPGNSSFGKLSQQDLMGYATIRSLRGKLSQSEDEADIVNKRHHHLPGISTRESLENYLRDGLSLSSLSSVQKFSIKENCDLKGQCYLGITLPLKIQNLFPVCSVTSRRLSYTDKNTLFEENASDTESDHNLTEGSSNSNKKKKFKHDLRHCFKCGTLIRQLPLSASKQQNESIPSTTTPTNPICPVQTTEDSLKSDVIKQVENIANPILIRITKQALLHYKQRNPDLFKDVCMYSEICKMLSETHYRLIPRRLLQELFLEVSYESLFDDNKKILVERENSPLKQQTLNNSSGKVSVRKKSIVHIANERRRVELTSKVVPQFKNVTKGFNVEPKSKNLNLDVHKANLGESLGENRYSPTKMEPRSPPLTLTSVKEEQFSVSNDDLLTDSSDKKLLNYLEKEQKITEKHFLRSFSLREKGKDSHENVSLKRNSSERPNLAEKSKIVSENLGGNLSSRHSFSEILPTENLPSKTLNFVNTEDLPSETVVLEKSKEMLDEQQKEIENKDKNKTDEESSKSSPIIKPLDTLNFIYNENKFPIKHREANSNAIK